MLWLLHHYLFDLAYLPAWDDETRHIWDDYREVNRTFAEALAAEETGVPVYLVQDYQLAMVPSYLRELRPDARIAHFTHTPFAGPTYLRLLPAGMREDLLRGMLGADVLGFQADRWVENFLLCVRESLDGVRVDIRRRRIEVDGRRVLVRAYPIALDPGPLRRMAALARGEGSSARSSATGAATRSSCCASTGWSCRRTSCAATRPTTRS